MATSGRCFDGRELDRLLEGDMSRREESEAVQHLAECSACQHGLEDVAGDECWWSESRAYLRETPVKATRVVPDDAHGVLDSGKETIIAQLMDWLGPTDDPNKLGRVGNYEVIGVIGYGATGAVLKALDSRLNRHVAIKVLLPAFAHRAAPRRRFERESRAIAAISHEHVVPVFAVDEFNGLPYIVMQYVPGISLQQRIDRHGPLHATEITRIAAQIARALAIAHGQGIIHRDIKPANILLENGMERVMVTDFGLARVVDEATLTQSGVVAGTPQYMAPEQANGESIDHRADLFSLGSVMYAMCVARPPFRAQTVMGVLRKVCDSTPRPVREINPEIPRWLEAFIQRLLAKHREDRFETAGEVAEILEAELAHLQSPTCVNEPLRPWMPMSGSAPKSSNLGQRVIKVGGALSIVGICLWALLYVQGNDKYDINGQSQRAAAAKEDNRATESSEQLQSSDMRNEWGSLEGRVVFDAYADSALQPYIGNESLIIDRSTNGVKNCVVYLYKKPQYIHPSLKKLPNRPVEIACMGQRFSPRVQLVQVGQSIDFVNRSSKPVAHFKYQSPQSSPTNVVVPEKYTWKPTQGAGLPLLVSSDFNHRLRAYLMILDHPYACVTDDKGEFRLEKLPAGEHQIGIWHETLGALWAAVSQEALRAAQPITIRASQFHKQNKGGVKAGIEQNDE